MKKMVTIFADKGKILTNGVDYGTTISLAEDETDEGYYEITQEEYKRMLAEKNNEEIDDEIIEESC